MPWQQAVIDARDAINHRLGIWFNPDNFTRWNAVNIFLMVLVLSWEVVAVFWKDANRVILIVACSISIFQSLLDLLIEIYARNWKVIDCPYVNCCCASWRYNGNQKPLLPFVMIVGLCINIAMLLLAIFRVKFDLAVLTLGIAFIVLMLKIEASLKNWWRAPSNDEEEDDDKEESDKDEKDGEGDDQDEKEGDDKDEKEGEGDDQDEKEGDDKDEKEGEGDDQDEKEGEGDDKDEKEGEGDDQDEKEGEGDDKDEKEGEGDDQDEKEGGDKEQAGEGDDKERQGDDEPL